MRPDLIWVTVGLSMRLSVEVGFLQSYLNLGWLSSLWGEELYLWESVSAAGYSAMHNRLVGYIGIKRVIRRDRGEYPERILIIPGF